MSKGLLIVFVVLAAARGVEARIINVPRDHLTIQAAINASASGDTVLVAPGTYRENIVFRGKRIVVTSLFGVNGNLSHITGTVIDGSAPANSDSGSCVRIVNGEDTTAVLQGFTLTGGYGTLWTDEHGAGQYWEGGGILIAFSNPTIRYNIIRNNNVNRPGGASTGGGGIRLGDSSPRILNNIIMNNAGQYGGGIVSNFASPVIRNNIIAFNTVSQAIAGTPTYGGGGLWFNGGVAGNRIENNTIVGNSSAGGGGSGAEGRGGGMLAVFGAAINTRNNIVWGNTQTTGSQIGTVAGTASVAFSDVEGGFTGVGNINLNPQFADTSFYLLPTSPCIDAGDSNVIYRDREDPLHPGSALWPSRGLLRNDIGAYGGPAAGAIGNIITDVKGTDQVLSPIDLSLEQNYPNPFNPSTQIEFRIGKREYVTLRVFDVLGREVTTLVSEPKQPGRHTVTWRAERVSSGVYFCRLEARGFSATRKLVVLR